LASLHPDKLQPSPESVPERFEQGTLPFADLAGVAAAVEHLASIEPAASSSRRERLLASMTSVESYEGALFASLLRGLGEMDHVTTYGNAQLRAPTTCFNVAGRTPREVARHLGEHKVNVWNGDNYAFELAGVLKIREGGGAVRAGIVHYNDQSDVDRLLAAVAELG
jgi:selenocysteine lyase/cysteine desulfurase